MGLLVLRVIEPCGFHLANLGLVICQEHGTRVSPRPKIARWLACLSLWRHEHSLETVNCSLRLACSSDAVSQFALQTAATRHV
jgi:hypothetical protein